MNIKKWPTERLTWLGGFVLAIASVVVALAMDRDIPGRVTQWKPTEEARAHRIRNGGEDVG